MEKPWRINIGALATLSCTHNLVIEIYLGTLQPKDFPYWPIFFEAVGKM